VAVIQQQNRERPDMMNPKATSRIVVGVSLAVVFAVAISSFIFPANHGTETEVAQNALGATASRDQIAANSPAANAAAPD